MGVIRGFEAKLYRQTTGSRVAWPGSGAAPNLDLIDGAKDVTINVAADEVDASNRGGGGWKYSVKTLREASIEWEMNYDKSDADFLAFLAAALAGTTIAIAALDGGSSTAGTQGLWIDAQLSIEGGITQPLGDISKVKFMAKAAPSSVAPAWITVA